jgi:hypothetical protein
LVVVASIPQARTSDSGPSRANSKANVLQVYSEACSTSSHDSLANASSGSAAHSACSASYSTPQPSCDDDDDCVAYSTTCSAAAHDSSAYHDDDDDANTVAHPPSDDDETVETTNSTHQRPYSIADTIAHSITHTTAHSIANEASVATPDA